MKSLDEIKQELQQHGYEWKESVNVLHQGIVEHFGKKIKEGWIKLDLYTEEEMGEKYWLMDLYFIKNLYPNEKLLHPALWLEVTNITEKDLETRFVELENQLLKVINC